jgi:DNA-binding transcriptional ArsR family regulator
MNAEREVQRLADELRLLREAIATWRRGTGSQSGPQLALMSVLDELGERSAVEFGEAADLDSVEARLEELLPPDTGVGVLLGGIIHDQATSRWHKVAAWTNFADLPDGGMSKFPWPFSSPHRVELLHHLALGVSRAADLRKATAMTVGQFYHHLGRLAEAGLVLRISSGKYALAMRGKVALACLATVCELLEQWPQQLGERRLREDIAADASAEEKSEVADEAAAVTDAETPDETQIAEAAEEEMQGG